MKINNYWRIYFEQCGHSTIFFAVVKAKSPEKAICRFYKEHRLRWYENASNYNVIKIEQLEVELGEKEN